MIRVKYRIDRTEVNVGIIKYVLIKNDGKVLKVTLKTLKRLHREGRLTHYIPDYLRMKLGIERRKERSR